MSQILSPPQRRPDLIGQCESCKTIAIFSEEEQFVDEEYVPVEPKIERSYSDKPDLLIPQPSKKVLATTAQCPGSDWCKTYGKRVKLHTLGSSIGVLLKERADGDPTADINFWSRQMDESFAPMREMQDRWNRQAAARKAVEDQATKPGLVARISDAWGWFWRKE